MDREDDPGVAARMSPSEVVEIDPVVARADRHALREGLRRQPAAHRVGEDVGRRLGAAAVGAHHLHVRRRDLVGDDVDVGGERDVAAHVVVVAVRVDEGGHRVAGELADRVEDRLAPARVLGVDDDDPAAGDEDGRVAAAPLPAQDVEVVLELLDLDDHRVLRVDDRERQCTDAEHDGQDDAAFHVIPPRVCGKGAMLAEEPCVRNAHRSVVSVPGGGRCLARAVPRRPGS